MKYDQFKLGQYVRMLCETAGDDSENVQRKFDPGTIGRIAAIDLYGGVQGQALTIVIAETITNVFDEADDDSDGPFFEALPMTETVVYQPSNSDCEAIKKALRKLYDGNADAAINLLSTQFPTLSTEVSEEVENNNELERWQRAVSDGATTLGFDEWRESGATWPSDHQKVWNGIADQDFETSN